MRIHYNFNGEDVLYEPPYDADDYIDFIMSCDKTLDRETVRKVSNMDFIYEDAMDTDQEFVKFMHDRYYAKAEEDWEATR